MSWSTASQICRIDWRPSPGLGRALTGLALLALVALWLTPLPAVVGVPSGLAMLCWSRVQSRRQLRQAPCRITWPGRGEPALIESTETVLRIDAVSVHLRGPMAVLSGRDEAGRCRRWVWYPDTLDVSARRALRLAASRPLPSPSTLPVAAA